MLPPNHHTHEDIPPLPTSRELNPISLHLPLMSPGTMKSSPPGPDVGPAESKDITERVVKEGNHNSAMALGPAGASTGQSSFPDLTGSIADKEKSLPTMGVSSTEDKALCPPGRGALQ